MIQRSNEVGMQRVWRPCEPVQGSSRHTPIVCFVSSKVHTTNNAQPSHLHTISDHLICATHHEFHKPVSQGE